METKRYQFIRTLKESLAGKVKLARDTRDGSLVVVKISSRRLLDDLKKRRCAENPLEEIRLLTKLQGSNLKDGSAYVISLLDTYSFQRGADIFDCSVLEFADGGEFFEHVQQLALKGDRLDQEFIKASFSMIAKGVAYIHNNNMCHLDLSLENVLLSEGVAKICDFGLAREGRCFKSATDSPGKIPYMAPEVFRRQVYIDVKTSYNSWLLNIS